MFQKIYQFNPNSKAQELLYSYILTLNGVNLLFFPPICIHPIIKLNMFSYIYWLFVLFLWSFHIIFPLSCGILNFFYWFVTAYLNCICVYTCFVIYISFYWMLTVSFIYDFLSNRIFKFLCIKSASLFSNLIFCLKRH